MINYVDLHALLCVGVFNSRHRNICYHHRMGIGGAFETS